RRQGAAGCSETDPFRFDGLCALSFVNLSCFEQPHVTAAPVQVVGQHIQHARDKRGSHNGSFFTQRIGKSEGGGRRETLRILARNKRERHGLVIAKAKKGAAQLAVLRDIRLFHHSPGEGGQRIRE